MHTPSSPLPPSSSIIVSVQALLRQGEYGAITEIARAYGLSRQQVYSYRDKAKSALEEAFTENQPPPDSFSLTVTDADIARTVVGLRAVTPSSIRDIVAILPIIYGRGWSFGKVQALLVEAGERAASLCAGVDLSTISHIALDEMFSQGRPVFAGIDLDTQYLFQLETHENRSGEEWSTSLGKLRDEQGLHPSSVVKDAGSGLRKGVSEAYPDVEQNDDLFHASQFMGKVALGLERKAYAAIARVEELDYKRAKSLDKDESIRRSIGQQLHQARKHEEEAIERYDRFEMHRQEAMRVLELTDPGCGRLRTSKEVVEVLTELAGKMEAIGGKHVKSVARYIRNRAPGLSRYLDDLSRRLDEVTEEVGGPKVVEAAVRAYQANLVYTRGGARWKAKARNQELDSAVACLLEVTGRDPQVLWNAVHKVFPILHTRHRASSAIENLNSVLRPYLVVQKSTSKSFLDLFRFYWNTRTREWGPYKGTSAYEMLTGVRVDDWLTLLGYPPGEAMAKAA